MGVFLVLGTLLTVLMLPDPWAWAAGAVFGLAGGAAAFGILSTVEHSDRRRALRRRSEQQRLRDGLAEVDEMLRTRSGRLPPSTQGQLRMMTVGLDEIVERWEDLERLPEQQEGVRRTVESHLPRTIELFLALPDEDKPRHAQEFKAQVGLLAEAVAKTRDTVVAKNLQALQTNRWLLEESLGDPDETLFRENGL
ncbi:hypothetical protein GCM10027060_21550 [Nesterenkonia halophila]|uniref:hypothetical protein n=1 Tax=Nesterenkonia halophila TaxID=302044 RepID=UPI001290FCA3|nr:hypothetical protein [Nesterenkonia halophila]